MFIYIFLFIWFFVVYIYFLCVWHLSSVKIENLIVSLYLCLEFCNLNFLGGQEKVYRFNLIYNHEINISKYQIELSGLMDGSFWTHQNNGI